MWTEEVIVVLVLIVVFLLLLASTSSTMPWWFPNGSARNASHPKVLVLSISDRPTLSDITHRRLKEYCSRHNYDVDIRTSSLDTSRHIAWSKIKLLQERMQRGGYDYYVWVDDDIYITDLSKSFSYFIDNYTEKDDNDWSIIISQDVDVPCCPFNSGLFIVRAGHDNVFRLLQSVWELSSETGTANKPLWEQDAMVHYWQNIDSNPFVIVPHRVLQSFYRDTKSDPQEYRWQKGDFAAHMCGMSLERRLARLDEVVRMCA